MSQTELKTLEQVENETILTRLEAMNYNRTHTAASLRIGIRTLQRRLKNLEVNGFTVPLNPKKTTSKETV